MLKHMSRFHAAGFVLSAVSFGGVASHAAEPMEGTNRFVHAFTPSDLGDGVLAVTCTDGTVASIAARNPPRVRYVPAGDETGLVEILYMESEGVIWRLKRLKIVPVHGCRLGEPVPFVAEESYVTSNPVEKPDTKQLFRRPLYEKGADGFTVRIETRSEKVFLDPDGGRAYARYLKTWPDDTWRVEFDQLRLKRFRSDFDEPTARWRLADDHVRARDGWVRVDTPLQRSEEPPIR